MGKSGTKALASTGGANTVAAAGTVGGSTANATLSTSQLASHSHTSAGTSNLPMPNFNSGPRVAISAGGSTGNTGSGTGHSHNMSATFSGTATSVLQPYLTVIYIIKT